MILRNRGAKTPLLSVDLTPARVALNLRERGAVFPCKWCSVAEIYTLIFSPHISTSIPKWDFISHYMQNKINCNRVRQVVSAVADTNFFIRKEMALISAISKQ